MSDSNPDVQAVGLLLLLSFCAALIIVGILMSRTRLWGAGRDDKGSAVKTVGFLMTASGAIVGAIALMFLVGR